MVLLHATRMLSAGCAPVLRAPRARVAMALSRLSGDEQGILFVQLCNVLDPGVAVALSSVSNEPRTATRVPLQELKTGHEAAAALCRKLGHQNCKALRAAKVVLWYHKGLTADELKLLGTLGSVLPALDTPVSYTHLTLPTTPYV